MASVSSFERLQGLYIKPMLTQSEGELVEPLQLGHKGTDRVPGLLLKGEVTWVLDGLQVGTQAEAQLLLSQKIAKNLHTSSFLSSLR